MFTQLPGVSPRKLPAQLPGVSPRRTPEPDQAAAAFANTALFMRSPWHAVRAMSAAVAASPGSATRIGSTPRKPPPLMSKLSALATLTSLGLLACVLVLNSSSSSASKYGLSSAASSSGPAPSLLGIRALLRRASSVDRTTQAGVVGEGEGPSRSSKSRRSMVGGTTAVVKLQGSALPAGTLRLVREEGGNVTARQEEQWVQGYSAAPSAAPTAAPVSSSSSLPIDLPGSSRSSTPPPAPSPLPSGASSMESPKPASVFRNTLSGCPPLPKVQYGRADSFSRHYPQPRSYDRAECRCTPVHNFVILSMQRSGSGWFEATLNSHPNISSFGEIFGKSRGKTASLGSILKTLDRVYNLDWNNSAAKDSCTGAAGLKWMLNQGAMMHHAAVLEYFRRNYVSVILLVRRNVLRRLISILANAHDRKARVLDGQHKSHVHTAEDARRLAEYRPHIEVRHLVGNLERVQQMVEDALKVFRGTRIRVISYESIVRNATVLDDVQRFLGVPVRELSSQQVKIHTRPLSDSIQNYEEVARKLRGTSLEFVLHEDS